MTRKLQQLSKILNDLTPDEQELWKTSIQTAKPVLDVLCRVIGDKARQVDKEMRLNSLAATANPGALLLGLQAKREAYEEILNLILDK